jgi:hypothetical protein
MPDKRCAEAVAFRHLYQANRKTSRAWSLKESFAAFWNYRYPKPAQDFFDAWSSRAMRSRIEPMKSVATMLRRHSDGLFNYTKHRITNAAAEGFNSIIQTIKANARGFRSFGNFRIRILFFCGKLDLMPTSVRSHCPDFNLASFVIGVGMSPADVMALCAGYALESRSTADEALAPWRDFFRVLGIPRARRIVRSSSAAAASARCRSRACSTRRAT